MGRSKALWAAVASAGLAVFTGCLPYHQGAMPGEPEGSYVVLRAEPPQVPARTTGDPESLVRGLNVARVRYEVRGQGPAILLLHGFASALDAWDVLAPELAERHTVVRLDLMGFGWSDRPEGDYSPFAQARLCFALLDQLGISDVAVVGHSWGASVAMAMALEAPERVRRLALYDAWAYEEQLPTFFWWARAEGLGEAMFWLYYKERTEDRMAMAFHDPDLLTQPLVDAIHAALERPGTVRAALEAARAQRYEDWAVRYPEITQPTLLLWGAQDVISPPWVGERLLRELPNARLEVYGQCGHFPMLEARHASTRALREFMAPPGAAATRTLAPVPGSATPHAGSGVLATGVVTP